MLKNKAASTSEIPCITRSPRTSTTTPRTPRTPKTTRTPKTPRMMSRDNKQPSVDTLLQERDEKRMISIDYSLSVVVQTTVEIKGDKFIRVIEGDRVMLCNS